MQSSVLIALACLLLPSAGFSQIILMTPQPPSFGSIARGYTPGSNASIGGYPGNPRVGTGTGDLVGNSTGARAPVPCGSSGIDGPPPQGQFRPPISPDYQAFSDRFAPPAPAPAFTPDACN